MPKYSRRRFLKTGLAVSAMPAAAPSAHSFPVSANEGDPLPQEGEGIGAGVSSLADPGSPRERLLLDFGWRFHLGHADDPLQDFGYGLGRAYQQTGESFVFIPHTAQPGQLGSTSSKSKHATVDAESRAYRFGRPGPCSLNFNDDGWQHIDLPHDWAVELPFQEDPELTTHGSKPLGRNYPATSIGWYRRVFEIPESDRGRRLSLEFDGVFRDSIAALNGNFLGRNMSGYAPFRYDITDHVEYGRKNVLVLRVDATESEGWFYEGAGIYRHVWLVKTQPLHVPQWGTFVTSKLTGSEAALAISTEIAHEGDGGEECRLVSTIFDQEGKKVAESRSEAVAVPGWGRTRVKQQIGIPNAELWSIERPYLYRLMTTIESGGTVCDRYETSFGIRTIRFDANQGFFLNGKRVEIKGTCNHQDHAGVGTALPDRLQVYRIAKLKEMGSNGLRTSHNPPTPELLDACDRLGMVVLDETRMFSSSAEGLSQLSRLVRRDRNRPSVVFWSTGNEEPEQGSSRGARICTTMKALVRRLDPTRPITQAMDNDWGKGISAVLDVQGFNYKQAPQIDAFHREFPSKPSVGTEVGSTVSTRGIYSNDPKKGYVSAYDVNYPYWAATAEQWWQIYDPRRFLSGGFVWTGFDYRGEPTPYGWPCISSHFGILDTCGFPKDNFYYYKAWWGGEPVLHLFPHWTWPGKEGEAIDVWCHSNLETIELFLNGQSLGKQTMQRDSHVAWKVNYAPGTIEARGYRGGELMLTAKRETTGHPAKILLHPDRTRIAADGEDVSVVEVRILDSDGRLSPVADNEVSFEISGPGKLIGVGNGDPSSHEADKGSRRRAFNGLCVAIVQGGKRAGDITLYASSPGLASATTLIHAEPASPRPVVG